MLFLFNLITFISLKILNRLITKFKLKEVKPVVKNRIYVNKSKLTKLLFLRSVLLYLEERIIFCPLNELNLEIRLFLCTIKFKQS